MTPSLTAAEFVQRLRALSSERPRHGPNRGSIGCDRCENCVDCMFCSSSTGLERCQYCSESDACAECSHCVRCRGCLACHHCIESERCMGSAYLVRSVACNACTYCFGCVGLSRRDFHILNEPYDRVTYFAVTSRLARDLRLELP